MHRLILRRLKMDGVAFLVGHEKETMKSRTWILRLRACRSFNFDPPSLPHRDILYFIFLQGYLQKRLDGY